MLVASHPPFSVGFSPDDENAAQKLSRAFANHILRPARRADGYYVSFCGDNFRVFDCPLDSLDQTGKARLCVECISQAKAENTPLSLGNDLAGWSSRPRI